MTTQPAFPPSVPVEDENALLARVEAELADEVRQLALALTQFGGKAQAISIKIPESADFAKLITLFFGVLGFEFGNLFLQALIKRPLFGKDSEYLRELHLQCKNAFVQFDLEGQQFLAVALVDQVRDGLPKEIKRAQGAVCKVDHGSSLHGQ